MRASRPARRVNPRAFVTPLIDPAVSLMPAGGPAGVNFAPRYDASRGDPPAPGLPGVNFRDAATTTTIIISTPPPPLHRSRPSILGRPHLAGWPDPAGEPGSRADRYLPLCVHLTVAARLFAGVNSPSVEMMQYRRGTSEAIADRCGVPKWAHGVHVSRTRCVSTDRRVQARTPPYTHPRLQLLKGKREEAG
ncbi:unnamed protein product [Lampetra planeri]